MGTNTVDTSFLNQLTAEAEREVKLTLRTINAAQESGTEYLKALG